MKSAYVNGVKTFAPQSQIELIDYALKHKKILVAINAEKILHASKQSRSVINRNLGYPDGIGAVWALQKKGLKDTVKIPGCELWLDIISYSNKNKTFYLVGGKQDVIEETVKKLKREFKNINILNYCNGYINTNQKKLDLLQDIKTLKPDIVFVAMGSPKQEILMEEMQKIHEATYQGLGGSFDVYVGNVNRAPEWWVKSNLEWAYRLIKQPSRIKRQIHLLQFIVLLKFNKL
jgi:UDP-N-acetyl-D-mannosaminouronate:lipid I N-acetyl-D-mannosaminouronosyltransferase